MTEGVHTLAVGIATELRQLEIEAVRMVANPVMQTWYRFEDRTYRRKLLDQMVELGLILSYSLDTLVVKMP